MLRNVSPCSPGRPQRKKQGQIEGLRTGGLLRISLGTLWLMSHYSRDGQEIEIAAQKAPKWTKIVIIPQSESASILINRLK